MAYYVGSKSPPGIKFFMFFYLKFLGNSNFKNAERERIYTKGTKKHPENEERDQKRVLGNPGVKVISIIL